MNRYFKSTDKDKLYFENSKTEAATTAVYRATKTQKEGEQYRRSTNRAIMKRYVVKQNK